MTARQRRTGGSRAANWQQRWNPFWSLADPARLRRARALARDGHVLRWSVQGGRVEALVRSVRSARDQYRVSLPFVDWWEPYRDSVAEWFRLRPDWLGALLAGCWPEEFVALSADAGLRLCPDAATAERMRDGASCTCLDGERLCKHVLAVAVQLVDKMEASPLEALALVGLPPHELMDLVHARTAAALRQALGGEGDGLDGRESDGAPGDRGERGEHGVCDPAAVPPLAPEAPELSPGMAGSASETGTGVASAPVPHRIVPVFDEQKLEALRFGRPMGHSPSDPRQHPYDPHTARE